MLPPPLPGNETSRLAALRSYAILDTLPEQDYDDIARFAAKICGTPIALISLVDKQRQWFKSRYGLTTSETPREHSYCAHNILDPDELMVVPDARKDERFVGNPLLEGDPQAVFYTGAPLVDEHGYALGSLCVIDNKPRELDKDQLTSLKSLSRQITRLLELRRREEETQALNEQLKTAYANLEEFTSIVAHDLRAPLRNIKQFAHILREEHAEDLPQDAADVVEMISDCSTSAHALVQGVLGYSRALHTLKENATSVGFQDLLLQIVGGLDLPDDFSINYHGLPDYQVHTNQLALNQIMRNLLSNAVHHNHRAAGGAVEVHVHEEDPVRVTVSDNGPGIPAHLREAVFHRFQTLGPTHSASRDSTGVGLAIVHKLVNGLGGDVWVEGNPTGGATFAFTLSPR